MSRSDRFRFLRSLDLLHGFDDEALRELEGELERVALAGGGTLIRQGEPGHRVYLLRSGRLRVQVAEPDGSALPVGEVSRGEWVGEMALLTDQPRSATVVALRDCELLALGEDGFRRLLARHPEAALGLVRLIVQRLQRTLRSGAPSGRPRTFALIPAGSGGATSRLLPPLVQALGELGTIRVLTRESMARRFAPGEADPSSASLPVSREEIVPWLNEQEEQAACLLYVATARSTPWNELCVHHHLRIGQAGDHRRLARLLTGRALGLVLGGGGARGLAHIGVLRALEEREIPVDRVGGASFGAIVGALHAMGRSATAGTACWWTAGC